MGANALAKTILDEAKYLGKSSTFYPVRPAKAKKDL